MAKARFDDALDEEAKEVHGVELDLATTRLVAIEDDMATHSREKESVVISSCVATTGNEN